MRRTLVLAFLLSFTVVIPFQAQLPANLDCKCTATGDGEYLCKCVAAKGSEPLTKSPAKPLSTSAPLVLPEPPQPMTNGTVMPTATSGTATTRTAARTAETPTGTSTTKGQPIYTSPRGGQYHYSGSGTKVYIRKK